MKKKHYLYWKYINSDKSDLFTDLLKATSSFVISKLFLVWMTRSQKKFLRKFLWWKFGYNFHWWPVIMECNLMQNMSGMIDTQFTKEYFIGVQQILPKPSMF